VPLSADRALAVMASCGHRVLEKEGVLLFSCGHVPVTRRNVLSDVCGVCSFFKFPSLLIVEMVKDVK